MRHYEKHEIDLCLSGRNGRLARLLCRRHLRECALCGERRDEIGRDEDFLRDVRRRLRELDEESILLPPMPPAPPKTKLESEGQDNA